VRITSMLWTNESSEPLLLVGSAEGKVRVWRDPLERRGEGRMNGSRLVAAWTALPELLRPGSAGPGLVLSFQQRAGHLLCGGKASAVAVWDLATERECGRIEVGARSYTTALASYGPTLGLGGHGVAPELDQGFSGHAAGGDDGSLFVVGCGDGSLRFFDKRLRSGGHFAANVAQCQGHRSWVVGVQVPRGGGGRAVVSGSVSGEIRIWDVRLLSRGSPLLQRQLDSYYERRAADPSAERPRPRLLQPERAFQAHRAPMTAFAAHEYAPVMASGSHHQFLRIFNYDGESLAQIRHHEGYFRQRIGPVSALAWHPYKMLVSVGAIDPIVSLYSPA
jgi:regulator-associated protein of mTOR